MTAAIAIHVADETSLIEAFPTSRHRSTLVNRLDDDYDVFSVRGSRLRSTGFARRNLRGHQFEDILGQHTSVVGYFFDVGNDGFDCFVISRQSRFRFDTGFQLSLLFIHVFKLLFKGTTFDLSAFQSPDRKCRRIVPQIKKGALWLP